MVCSLLSLHGELTARSRKLCRCWCCAWIQGGASPAVCYLQVSDLNSCALLLKELILGQTCGFPKIHKSWGAKCPALIELQVQPACSGPRSLFLLAFLPTNHLRSTNFGFFLSSFEAWFVGLEQGFCFAEMSLSLFQRCSFLECAPLVHAFVCALSWS